MRIKFTRKGQEVQKLEQVVGVVKDDVGDTIIDYYDGDTKKVMVIKHSELATIWFENEISVTINIKTHENL